MLSFGLQESSNATDVDKGSRYLRVRFDFDEFERVRGEAETEPRVGLYVRVNCTHLRKCAISLHQSSCDAYATCSAKTVDVIMMADDFT